MSRQSKSVPQAKKVMPPAVPDMYGKIGLNNGGGGGGGGPPTAVIYDTGDGAGRNGGTAVVAGTVILEHHLPSLDGTNSVVTNSSVGGGSSSGGTMAATVGAGAALAAAAPSSLLLRCGPDGIVDYGLDDQGIDLTQSPGRDSPVSLSGSAGSGSRHSTASLDSGRASSYLTGASNSSNRSVSGVGSYGVLSSPRCSVSSCSIGSGSGGGGGPGVGCSHRLSNHSSSGSRTDHDIISEWLMEIHFHEYTYLFLEAGYDLPTIARMTPEDLTAIGIRKPNHRERLKRHIDALKLPDALPGYVPGSIDEWLRLLRLEEYVQPLLAQGYQTVHDVTQLTWEDLEDIGIVKLGHQKKILLAIKRVKDIISGKMMGSTGGMCIGGGLGGYALSPTIARSPAVAAAGHVRALHHYDDMSIGLRSDSSKQHHLGVNSTGSYSTFLRQQTVPAAPPPPSALAAHQMITYPHVHFDGTQAVYRRSSYDDSDITPTNEKSSALLALSEDHHHFAAQQGAGGQQQQQQQQPSPWTLQQQQQFVHQQIVQLQQQQQQQYFQGGGTLPRQHQRNSYGVRLALLSSGPGTNTNVAGRVGATAGGRPIAKIVANNLKLPSPALEGGAAGGGGSAVAAPSDSGDAPPDSITYPVPLPMPPLLGQIENVEMATAALDAMHFANYTSSPYAVQHHHMHHHTLTLVTKESSGGGGAPVANATVTANQQQSQQQPIYHNHPSMLLQSHSQQQLLHHHASASSSTQSTPSPPTLASGLLGGPISSSHLPHAYGGGYAGQTLQTTVEVHKVCGQHDNKSNSSLESIDQIPFANENAGTIKQRSSLNRMEQQQQQQHHYQQGAAAPLVATQQHPLLLPTLSSSSSSSSSSLTGSITTTLATTGCLQPLSPSTTQPVPSVGTAVAGTANSLAAAVSSPAIAPPSTAGSAEESTAAVAPTATASQDIYGTNVLNDIGSMLANLTDELDAMLEEEKCAGISDNE
uniref:SAM domain-containing protein n=1 Tax=Anopheles christyi TaxID=43041 RepID=A0A182KF27_9DIPT